MCASTYLLSFPQQPKGVVDDGLPDRSQWQTASWFKKPMANSQLKLESAPPTPVTTALAATLLAATLVVIASVLLLVQVFLWRPKANSNDDLKLTQMTAGALGLTTNFAAALVSADVAVWDGLRLILLFLLLLFLLRLILFNKPKKPKRWACKKICFRHSWTIR